MLLFCPNDGNMLYAAEGEYAYQFQCRTCPYVYFVTEKISERKYPKLKVSRLSQIKGSPESQCAKCFQDDTESALSRLSSGIFI